MRKEVLFAITAGAIFGIVLAFGVWRANTALRPEPSKEEPQAQNEATPSPSPEEFDIAIAKPDQKDVITESPLLLSGVTKTETWVAISAEEDDYIIKSDKTGKFEQDIELVGGVNQIVITAFDEDGGQVLEHLLVVYSTEFTK